MLNLTIHRYHGLNRVIATAILGTVVLVVYLILEIVDRLTASDAMRARVNASSEKFFAERGSVWQAALRSTGEFLGRFSGRWF